MKNFTRHILNLLVVLTLLFFIFIIFSLLFRGDYKLLLGDSNIKKAVGVTLRSIITSNIFILILGIPFSFILSTRKGRIYKTLEVFSQLPILIPPAITGIAMFTAFGKNGNINLLLKDSNLGFKLISLILIQIFIGLPFFIQILKHKFDEVGREIVEAARVDGVSELDLLLRIYIPLSKRSILTGSIVSILRGVGEFGATMMFGGNLAGRTQTLTTLIYTYSQTNLDKAIALGGANILFFIIPLFLLKLRSQEEH